MFQVVTWSIPYADKRYALYDKSFSYVANRKNEVRTYVSKHSAQRALLKLNQGTLKAYQYTRFKKGN